MSWIIEKGFCVPKLFSLYSFRYDTVTHNDSKSKLDIGISSNSQLHVGPDRIPKYDASNVSRAIGLAH